MADKVFTVWGESGSIKHLTVLCQPPSKNRRERSELKPDYFDPASIMDESVRDTYTLAPTWLNSVYPDAYSLS